LLRYILHEDVLAGAAVVGVIVLNFYSHCAGISLESVFGHQGFVSCIQLLEVDEAESTEMVNKDGCDVIAHGCWQSFDLVNEAGDRQF
jgi:hypothetical protein